MCEEAGIPNNEQNPSSSNLPFRPLPSPAVLGRLRNVRGETVKVIMDFRVPLVGHHIQKQNRTGRVKINSLYGARIWKQILNTKRHTEVIDE